MTYLPPEPPGRPGAPIDIDRVMGALWRARWWFVILGVVGLIFGILFASFVMGPSYRSEAVMVWEAPRESDASNQARKLRTLADSIKLPRNLAEVRRIENLNRSLDQLGNAVSVIVRADSNLLIVKVVDSDPEVASSLANQVIETFIEHQRQLLREHFQEILNAVKQVRDVALDEMREARLAYDTFREENGILDLPAERTAAIEKAAILSATADHARADLEALQERVRALSTAKKNSDETAVLTEKEAAPARVALARAEAELDEISGVLSPDHPKVQALKAQIEALKVATGDGYQPVIEERIVGRDPRREHIERGLITAEADSKAALKRERTYNNLMDATRKQLSQLIRIEGKASEHLAVLELAKVRYAAAEESVAKAQDLARTTTPGLRLASPAIESPQPLPQRRRIVAAAIPMVLVALAFMLVVLLSMRGLRGHSTKEIAFWGGAPVVAATSWPRDDEGLAELCADLAPELAASEGATLVVPFSSDEAPLAGKLVDALVDSAPTSDSSSSGTEPVTSTGSDGQNPSQGETPQQQRPFNVSLWSEGDGAALRRACRDATRVLVVVRASTHSFFKLRTATVRAGRTDRIGFVTLGLNHQIASFPDRVGDAGSVWS